MKIFKRNILVLIIIVIVMAEMSSDIYLPSLPKISDFFHISYSVAQLTISFNLVGLSISGLLYGPLSDYYGRRPVMLSGIMIFTIASIACCFVHDIIMLIVVRFIQGFGTGVAGVIGYAIVKDMYSGDECAKNISIVNIVTAFSPVLGPILGSTIISYGYNWNILFIIISIVSVIVLICLFVFLKETLVVDRSGSNISFRSIMCKYKGLCCNYRFCGFALIHSLTIMWIWACVASLPFIFINDMSVPVGYYGYFVAINVTAYIIGAVINQRFVTRFGMSNMLILGLVLTTLSDSGVLILYQMFEITPLLAEIMWIPSGMGIAFILGNNMTCAFSEIKETGIGSAFILCLQTIFGAIGIYILSCFYNGTLVPVVIFPIVCSILCIVVYVILKVTNKRSLDVKI
ncbi:Bcr/CflA family efflux MFS transporter [Ehrlichia ruminantium]|uniref:Bcr/CflA family efflux transporter n=1 Tax=Ehrlichia ruminantium TaxID=779 RepID=A0AAE6UIP8_EHRRU|nr:multidrug effflux MFS transporter [Ehrlichia ruminantium]QGR02735.1 Bcr/CflA family efflux MFS transporter [Ehrlichia ruminantium]QGR03655.1 Bcr/CflA family efflux MFS transporter [Ehrlichia ruminantium]QGR04582.1 Bcr/CflA family efflux MFS transporter [Ehrlichia ruminantium]